MPDAREDLNRLRKALKIAAWLRASEITSIGAGGGDENDWREAMGTLATVDKTFDGYLPSTETRIVICQILAMFEAAADVVEERRKRPGYSATQQPAETRPEVKP